MNILVNNLKRLFVCVHFGIKTNMFPGEESTVPVRRPGEHLKPSDLLKGVTLSTGESVTPQMALMQTMAAMHKKVNTSRYNTNDNRHALYTVLFKVK